MIYLILSLHFDQLMKEAKYCPFILKETKKRAMLRWILMPFLIVMAPAFIIIRIIGFILTLGILGLIGICVNAGSNYPAPLTPLRTKIVLLYSRLVGFMLCFTLG